MQSINPATLAVLKTYEEMTMGEVEKKLHLSHKAWAEWRETGMTARSYLLRKLAVVLRTRQGAYAKIITDEMGKLYREALAEVEKCAAACDYYAEHGADFLTDQVIETDAQKSYVAFQPLGAILAIMPWNFPFWQAFRAAVPALLAGNVMVLKHASNVCGCAMAIEEAFTLAGYPKGVFQTVLLSSKHMEKVIAHEHIAAVTLTGSVAAGKAVAAIAGKHLKKTVLELGGSDPYIILADAELEKAVEACVTSRLINAGQSCIAAKRFIAVKEVYEPFLDRFVQAMRHKACGDPYNEYYAIGPMVSEQARDELHRQVMLSIRHGARCELGGEIPEEKGAYYPSTVLTGVKPGMPAYDEELFGPVASVIRAEDEEDAIRIANDTAFGLGAAIFTADTLRGEQIARTRLAAGSAFINTFVRSDPRLPFGGIGHSGYGRELAVFGIHEFVNIKTVYLAAGGS